MRGSGMRRVCLEQGQEEKGCCLFFHLLPPTPHKPSLPSIHPPPCAGMKQPHLKIPSLLKAGSARQCAPSGKLLNYAVTRWPGGLQGWGAWGGQPGCVTSSLCPLVWPWGSDLCQPSRWQGVAGGRQECLPEPGQLRIGCCCDQAQGFAMPVLAWESPSTAQHLHYSWDGGRKAWVQAGLSCC